MEITRSSLLDMATLVKVWKAHHTKRNGWTYIWWRHHARTHHCCWNHKLTIIRQCMDAGYGCWPYVGLTNGTFLNNALVLGGPVNERLQMNQQPILPLSSIILIFASSSTHFSPLHTGRLMLHLIPIECDTRLVTTNCTCWKPSIIQ